MRHSDIEVIPPVPSKLFGKATSSLDNGDFFLSSTGGLCLTITQVKASPSTSRQSSLPSSCFLIVTPLPPTAKVIRNPPNGSNLTWGLGFVLHGGTALQHQVVTGVLLCWSFCPYTLYKPLLPSKSSEEAFSKIGSNPGQTSLSTWQPFICHTLWEEALSITHFLGYVP